MSGPGAMIGSMTVLATIRPATSASEAASTDWRSVETDADTFEQGRDRIRAEMIPQGWRVIAWVVPRNPATLEPES